MQISVVAHRLLQVVFALSSSGAVLTRPRLERRLGAPTVDLNQAIAELARCGLLEPQRLRLTLSGLAVAVASAARSTAKPRGLGAKAAPASAVRAPIALFSQREAPRAVA